MERIHNTGTRPSDPRRRSDKTSAMAWPTSVRTDYKRVLTTGMGGKMLPIMSIPLLREDQLLSSTFRFGFEMEETEDMLVNPVRIAVHAWLVPKLAQSRFLDLSHLNRSFMKQTEIDDTTTPFFDTVDPFVATELCEILKTLGAHVPVGEVVNTDIIESYNAVWNYLAKETSPSLALRGDQDLDLAPAFWAHNIMQHVKPTFDQGLIHGEVALNVEQANMPVKGLYIAQNESPRGANVYLPDGTLDTLADPTWAAAIESTDKTTGYDVFAELQQNGITVSLANLELAKKTAAFARMRQQYASLGEDAVIDVLMSGVRIPDEGLRKPMQLARAETVFGMSQRYATDSGNLDKSVTRGQTMVDINIRTPPVNTGGTIMVMAEILPEQLFERQGDPALLMTDQDNLPNRLKDELDLEPVEIVYNSTVDTDHTDPTGIFGYAPKNHRWQRDIPNVGGRYHRPDADAAWDEERNRIWAVETVDPQLGTDFYLATNIHHEVFSDTVNDAFEVTANGVARIQGLTKFGPGLYEASDDYEKIEAHADTDRIEIPE